MPKPYQITWPLVTKLFRSNSLTNVHHPRKYPGSDCVDQSNATNHSNCSQNQCSQGAMESIERDQCGKHLREKQSDRSIEECSIYVGYLRGFDLQRNRRTLSRWIRCPGSIEVLLSLSWRRSTESWALETRQNHLFHLLSISRTKI